MEEDLYVFVQGTDKNNAKKIHEGFSKSSVQELPLFAGAIHRFKLQYVDRSI